MMGLATLVLIDLCVLVPSAALLIYLERKMAADLQARVGPNRAGRFGWLQPLADVLKLFQKRQDAPGLPLGRRERFWLCLAVATLFASVATLPLGPAFLLIDADMSVFIPFFSAAAAAVSLLFLGMGINGAGGVSRNTSQELLSGVRISAQVLTGVFPALVSLLALGIGQEGYRWGEWVGRQGFFPHEWNMFADPFVFLAFFLFYASGLVMFSVAPLDPGFSSVGLRGGLMYGLSGLNLSLFRFARFYGMFLWSVLAVALFCGAWSTPDLELGLDESWPMVFEALRALLVLVKAMLLMLVVSWLARVNPRLRVDQVTDFSWRVLAPLSVLALIGAAVLRVGSGWNLLGGGK